MAVVVLIAEHFKNKQLTHFRLSVSLLHYVTDIGVASLSSLFNQISVRCTYTFTKACRVTISLIETDKKQKDRSFQCQFV